MTSKKGENQRDNRSKNTINEDNEIVRQRRERDRERERESERAREREREKTKKKI